MELAGASLGCDVIHVMPGIEALSEPRSPAGWGRSDLIERGRVAHTGYRFELRARGHITGIRYVYEGNKR